MATNAHAITKLNVKVNHLEEKFIQLDKRIGALEADRKIHKKLPSTPNITFDESSASKNDSPLTRIGKDFVRIRVCSLFVVHSYILFQGNFFSFHKN